MIENSPSKKRLKLLKNLKFLVEFFKSHEKKKYLSSIGFNYLEYLLNILTPEIEAVKLSSHYKQIKKNVKTLLKLKEELEKVGFFKSYGNYVDNYEIIKAFFDKINSVYLLTKEFFKKNNRELIFNMEKAKGLDTGIIEAKKNEKNFKNKKLKKIDPNLNKITEELTYIFWFNSLYKDPQMDDDTFLKNLDRILFLLGINKNEISFDKVLKDVYEGNTNDISPMEVQDFFLYGLTDPTSFIYFKENLPIYKKPIIEEIKENPIKFRHSKFKIATQILEKSYKIRDYLSLKVIETPTLQPKTDLFILNSLINITCNGYNIDRSDKIPLICKNVMKFGRYSSKCKDRVDLLFGEGLTELSRKQFQIITSDKHKGIFKIVCTAIYPKQETSFKLMDEAFKLFEDQILTLSKGSKGEILTVYSLYEGNISINQGFSSESDEDKEESTNLKLKRSLDKRKKKKESEKETFPKGTKPFIIIKGIGKDSESINQVYKIEYRGLGVYNVKVGFLDEINDGLNQIKDYLLENYNYFKIGVDWVFKDQKANTQAIIYFEEQIGWVIRGFSIRNDQFKEVQTLVSVITSDRILEKKKSKPVILEDNMIIHISGYSFLVIG